MIKVSDKDTESVMDVCAAYLKQTYGASYGLDNPVDRARIKAIIHNGYAPTNPIQAVWGAVKAGSTRD